jgi:glycosyltransferase involved in cell wall biosynthesis
MDLRACDVIVPCRDEGRALPALFDRLDQLPAGFSIILVDNGSRDDTAAVARARGARVVQEGRAGYGSAVHAGVQAATAPLVAVIDGDGSLDPADLVGLRDRVAAGATMAVGCRRPVSGGVWPWHARAGTKLVAWWLRQRVDAQVHDIGPIRVCRRQDLLDLGVADRRFGYPFELMVKAVAAGWRIEEVDVAYGPRADGTRSKVSGSLVGTSRAIRDFARVARA